MTGHWEMMGIYTTKPFKTFTDHGFPEELIINSSVERLNNYFKGRGLHLFDEEDLL